LEVLSQVDDSRDISVGLVDVKSFWVEPPEEIAQRVLRVSQVVAPERLTVTTDCGFFPVPRWLASLKLKNMVEGTNMARLQLAG